MNAFLEVMQELVDVIKPLTFGPLVWVGDRIFGLNNNRVVPLSENDQAQFDDDAIPKQNEKLQGGMISKEATLMEAVNSDNVKILQLQKLTANSIKPEVEGLISGLQATNKYANASTNVVPLPAIDTKSRFNADKLVVQEYDETEELANMGKWNVADAKKVNSQSQFTTTMYQKSVLLAPLSNYRQAARVL